MTKEAPPWDPATEPSFFELNPSIGHQGWVTTPQERKEEERKRKPQHQPLEIYDAGGIDVAAIPPRGWLLGVSFCRKFISGLIGEGGVGKTSIRYAQYLAGATGRADITGEYVHHQFNTLIACLEDDLDEVRRRIAAVMLHHNVDPEQVSGRIKYCTPKGLRLLRETRNNGRVVGALYEELRASIDQYNIDNLSIDPFIKAHGVGENDNQAIDEVCSMLAELAHDYNCGVDLSSHTRKGNGAPGDAERERGASAKKDAGRLVRTATAMSLPEAEEFGLSETMRKALVRLDDGKVNLVPRADDAMWFKLVDVPLGNATLEYPRGDHVQAAERWQPPKVAGLITVADANRMLDRIDEGPGPGRRYSNAPNSRDRSVFPVMLETCPDMNEPQAKKLLADWIKNKVLTISDYDDPTDRKSRKGLFIGTRPGSSWEG